MSRAWLVTLALASMAYDLGRRQGRREGQTLVKTFAAALRR